MSRFDDAQRVYSCVPSLLFSLVWQLSLAMPRARAKRRFKRRLPPRNPYRKLSKEEIRLAKMWNEEDGMHLSEIGDLLRGDKSTITKLLVPRWTEKTDGWPQVLKEDAVDELVAHLDHSSLSLTGRKSVFV